MVSCQCLRCSAKCWSASPPRPSCWLGPGSKVVFLKRVSASLCHVCWRSAWSLNCRWGTHVESPPHPTETASRSSAQCHQLLQQVHEAQLRHLKGSPHAVLGCCGRPRCHSSNELHCSCFPCFSISRPDWGTKLHVYQPKTIVGVHKGNSGLFSEPHPPPKYKQAAWCAGCCSQPMSSQLNLSPW